MRTSATRPVMPLTNSSKIRRSRAEAESLWGWNCVPRANQSSMVLSMASTTPSGQRAVTAKPGGHFVDGHVVHAVDADLALAVDPFHQRARLHHQGVPMGRIGGVGVGQGAGQVLGDVQEEVAALGNVQQLHAAADAEHRHPPLGDQPHQRAVELLAAAVQQPHRRVQHETVDARIEVGPADQHHAVQQRPARGPMSASSSSGGMTSGTAPAFTRAS